MRDDSLKIWTIQVGSEFLTKQPWFSTLWRVDH